MWLGLLLFQWSCPIQGCPHWMAFCSFSCFLVCWLWTACLSYQGAHAKMFLLQIVALLKIHKWYTWWILIVLDEFWMGSQLLRMLFWWLLIPAGCCQKVTSWSHCPRPSTKFPPKPSSSTEFYRDPRPTAVFLRSTTVRQAWLNMPHLWNLLILSALENVGNILEVNSDEQETQRHACGFSW